MVIGHYAAALAAKAIEPRAPLWIYVVAAQLIDIAWALLVILGVEHLRLDPALPGSPLVLYDMPWTHSLPAALTWSLAAATIAARTLRLPNRAAIMIGLVVFSHWLGDLLVHRPDLALWPRGPEVGFALWNHPAAEQAVEIGLLGLAAMAWGAQRVRAGQHLAPALIFTAALVGVQLLVLLGPVQTDPISIATSALAVFIVLAGAAVLPEPRGRLSDRVGDRQS